MGPRSTPKNHNLFYSQSMTGSNIDMSRYSHVRAMTRFLQLLLQHADMTRQYFGVVGWAATNGFIMGTIGNFPAAVPGSGDASNSVTRIGEGYPQETGNGHGDLVGFGDDPASFPGNPRSSTRTSAMDSTMESSDRAERPSRCSFPRSLPVRVWTQSTLTKVVFRQNARKHIATPPLT